LGGRAFDIERKVRRREWARLLPGVYLNHTGEPTWNQRGWAGVLHFWPAALCAESALRAANGPGWRRRQDSESLRIAVAPDRKVAQVPGYRVGRLALFDESVQPNKGPPRVRIEEAAIDVAARARCDFDAIGVLADVCQSRRTTAARILEALSARKRVRRRGWLMEVMSDVAEGLGPGVRPSVPHGRAHRPPAPAAWMDRVAEALRARLRSLS